MQKHDVLILRLAGCMICLAFLGGCSSTRIGSDYGPAIEMSDCLGPYYAWRPDFEASLGGPTSPYYEVKDFIRDTIQNCLETRGFSRSAPESASFWIDYGLCTRTQGDPYDQFIQYEMGTLVVGVTDPASRQRIWRGWAETRVRKSATPEERRKRICRTVARILDRFPYAPEWVGEAPLEESVISVEPVPLTNPATP